MANIPIILLLPVLISVVYSKDFTRYQNGTNGVCVFNEKNYNPGEEWFTSDCKKWKCVKGTSENEMMMKGYACDYKKIKHRSCEAKTIPDKKYPECCTNEVVCDGDRPSHDNARVVRSAGGGYDPRWAAVDQGWKDFDRQRAQAWQQYGDSWRQGGHPSIPNFARVARSADGGSHPNWAEVDEKWKKLDSDRKEAWEKYGEAWKKGEHPTLPSIDRPKRSADGGYDSHWAAVDQGWRDLDRQRQEHDRERDRMHDERDRERDRIRDQRDHAPWF